MTRSPRLSEADVLAVLPRDRAVTVREVADAVHHCRDHTARSVLTRLARAGRVEQVPVRKGDVTTCLLYRRTA